MPAKTFPERTRRTGESSCLDPYTPILHRSWEAGVSQCDASVAHAASAGLPATYAVIYRYVTALRGGQPVRSLAPPRRSAAPGATPPSSMTARQLSYLLVRRPRAARPRGAGAHGTAPAARSDDSPDCDADGNLCPDGAPTDAQHVAALDETVLTQSPDRDLKRFAAGLQQDAAVRAACELPVQQWADGGPGDAAQAPQTPDVWSGEVGQTCSDSGCSTPASKQMVDRTHTLVPKAVCHGTLRVLFNTTNIYFVV